MITTQDGPQCVVDWVQGSYMLKLDVQSSGDLPVTAAGTIAEARRIAGQF